MITQYIRAFDRVVTVCKGQTRRLVPMYITCIQRQRLQHESGLAILESLVWSMLCRQVNRYLPLEIVRAQHRPFNYILYTCIVKYGKDMTIFI